jgi:facilitated trehalose transporter
MYNISASIFVVDRAGRRILLLISGIVMALPLGVIGAFFFFFCHPEAANDEWRSSLEWIPLFCLVVYMIGYSIGYACIPFLLLGEMLPGINFLFLKFQILELFLFLFD